MKKYNLMFMIIFGLIMLPSVIAFMPPTHLYLHDRTLEETVSDSPLFQKCKSDSDLCFGGNILADLSVIYYYTDARAYQVTHQPSFCQAMLDEAQNPTEEICAIGSCLHGPVQDIVSHEQMVPTSIRRTGLVNQIIHTFSEQHLDNIVQDRVPNLKNRALNVSRWNECRPLFKRVLQGNSEYKDKIASGEFDDVFDRFLSEIQGSVTSYDIIFRSKTAMDNIRVLPPIILVLYVGTLLLWILLFVLLIFRRNKSILNWISIVILLIIIFLQGWLFVANLNGVAFDTFINIISPISNLVPIGDPDLYLDQAVSNGKQFFTGDAERFIIGKDGSGFDALNEANSSVLFIDVILAIVLVLIIIAFIFFNLRRPKKSRINNLNL